MKTNGVTAMFSPESIVIDVECDGDGPDCICPPEEECCNCCMEAQGCSGTYEHFGDDFPLAPVGNIESLTRQLELAGFVPGDVVVIISEAEYERLKVAASTLDGLQNMEVDVEDEEVA